jgi:hypothetical protein
MKKLIDVVYIFGKGSPWQNNELRYSLRSVEKNLRYYRNVFLIGAKPDFIGPEVIEVPYKDVYANKQRNIMSKILRACNDSRISQEFMLFNDDYFLLEPTEAPTYPYYFDKDLKTKSNEYSNAYKNCIDETIQALQGKDGRHFDIHKPIIYNKLKFKAMVAIYDWNVRYGYIVKSMYCNHNNIQGVQMADNKINYPYRAELIEQINTGQPMFSIGDKALNQAMKAYIMKKFPNKSSFEI